MWNTTFYVLLVRIPPPPGVKENKPKRLLLSSPSSLTSSTKGKQSEGKTRKPLAVAQVQDSSAHSLDYAICHVPNLEVIKGCVWLESTGGGSEPQGCARASSEVHMEGGTSGEGVAHPVNTLR